MPDLPYITITDVRQLVIGDGTDAGDAPDLAPGWPALDAQVRFVPKARDMTRLSDGKSFRIDDIIGYYKPDGEMVRYKIDDGSGGVGGYGPAGVPLTDLASPEWYSPFNADEASWDARFENFGPKAPRGGAIAPGYLGRTSLGSLVPQDVVDGRPVIGIKGTSIEDFEQTSINTARAILDDGTEGSEITLPPGAPGGSDLSFAQFAATETTETYAAIRDGIGGTLLGKYTSVDLVRDAGADLGGSALATDALNEAYTAANAAIRGIKIIIPPGVYNLATSPNVPITRANTRIVGDSSGPVQFRTGGAGSIVQFGTDEINCFGGGLENVFFTATAPHADSRIIDIRNASSQTFDSLTFDSIRQVARLGKAADAGAGTPALYAGAPTFRRLRGNTHNADGAISFDCVSGTGLVMDDIIMSVKGVTFPTDGTSLHGALNTTFLRFGKGLWDTVMARGVLTNRYNRGLDAYIDTNSIFVNAYFDQCLFDYCKANGIRLAPVAAGANIRSVFFTGGWAVATDGHSVEFLSAPSTVTRNVSFAQVAGRQAGKNNWKFSGSGSAEAITLVDCRGIGANRLSSTNTGTDQDDLVILTSGVSVRGGRFGEDGFSYTGIAGNQGRYGMTVGGDVSAYEVTGAQFDGVTAPAQLGTNTTGSSRRFVNGNRRGTTNTALNYATTTTVTAPASNAPQTHTGATVDTLYLYGGTTSSVQHNGTQIADSTAGQVTINLRPGDTWNIIYTVAPTIKRVVAN